MNRLISAEFVRLFKSLVFKLCLLFSAGLGAFLVLVRWSDMKMNPEVYEEYGLEYSNADDLLFVGGVYLIFVIAILIGSFVGREYSDGTIRNKLTAGHTRSSIYASKFIVCAVADIMLHILYIVVVIGLGNLLIGGTTFSVTQIIACTVVSTIAVIAVTACLLLFSMLIQSKTIGSVACLVATLCMLFATMSIFQRLEEPEYYEGYMYRDEDTGEMVSVEREKNYRYLTGTKRKVYEVLNDVIPYSQLYQIAVNDVDHLGYMVLYDGILVVVMVGAGVLAFRKKDLK